MRTSVYGIRYTVYGIRRTKTHITMKRRMRMEYGYKHAVSAQEEGVNQTSHAMSNTRIDSPRSKLQLKRVWTNEHA